MPEIPQTDSGRSVEALSPLQALERLQQGALLVDVRESYETNFRIPDVPQKLSIPDSLLNDRYAEIPLDVPLVVLDNVGLRAKEIVATLAGKGCLKVAWVVGGVLEWVRDGMPVKVDRNYELAGQCSCKLKPVNPKEPPKWK